MTTLSAVFDSADMQKIRDEFNRLGDRCYLENAGANLYPKSLMQEVSNDLVSHIYMNPHTDQYTRDCIEQIRVQVLKHFNTDPSVYSVVFTSGTTQALKLIVESFRFHSNNKKDTECTDCGCFVYLRDNHTSVLGLREIAADRNADVVHISHQDFLSIINGVRENNLNHLDKYENEGNTLFVYPAESNFNGFKYPLSCIQKIKEGSLNNHIRKLLCKVNRNWYVLLDAACYVPTNKLDLAVTQPDFVCMSFYKLFGYPTGLGAVLVKNSSAHILSQKSYFGGGTVDVVLSSEDYHVKRKNLHESLEDGTIPFLSILALKHAFNVLHKLVPKTINNDVMDTINLHTYSLAKDLFDQMKGLHHKNGRRATVLYMDSDFSDIRKQGGIVTFNVLRDDGSYIGYAEFQHLANLYNIDVRTGCFCNSGSCQRHLKASNKEIIDMYKAGHKCGDEIDLIDGRPTGAIRASFAYYNTYDDVDKMIKFIHKCFLKTKFLKRDRIKPSFINQVEVIIKPEPKYSTVNIIEDKGYYKNVEIIPNPMQYIPRMVLEEIAIYPVKSCGAFKIDTAWMIGTKGFQYDREWMIVNDSGVCLTQKKNTRMCMIRPKIDLKKNMLVLYFNGKKPIAVPLEIEPQNRVQVQVCQSKVCSDIISGYDCGDEVADWISEALEVSYLRLLRQCDDDKRVVKSAEGDKKLSLSNQAQFLLINKATVRWLAKRIEDELFTDTIDQLTDRFRGNLIIDTDDELAEKEWHRVILGRHEFKVEGQCSRCQMVCIDQQTGEKTVEPLRTIAALFAGKLRFGIYLSYVGPVDTSDVPFLNIPAEVIPLFGDDNISRCESNAQCLNMKGFPNTILQVLRKKHAHNYYNCDLCA